MLGLADVSETALMVRCVIHNYQMSMRKSATSQVSPPLVTSDFNCFDQVTSTKAQVEKSALSEGDKPQLDQLNPEKLTLDASHERQSEPDDDLRKYIRAIKQQKDTQMSALKAEMLYVRARQYETHRQFFEALETYEECINLLPTLERAYEATTGLYMLIGQNYGAKRANDKHMRVFPNSPKAYYQLADILYRQKHNSVAIDCMKKYIELSPQDEITGRDYAIMGEVCSETYSSVQKESYYDKGCDLSPDNDIVANQALKYYFDKSKHQQVVKILKKFTESSPGQSTSEHKMNLLRVNFNELSNFQSVIDSGQNYIRQGAFESSHQRLSEVYRLIGFSYAYLGKTKEALDIQIECSEKLQFVFGLNHSFWGGCSSEQIIKLLTEKYRSQQYSKASTLINFGSLFKYLDVYDLAVEAYEEADRLDKARRRHDKAIRDELNTVFGRPKDVVNVPVIRSSSHSVDESGSNAENIFRAPTNNNNIFEGNRHGGGNGNIFRPVRRIMPKTPDYGFTSPIDKLRFHRNLMQVEKKLRKRLSLRNEEASQSLE